MIFKLLFRRLFCSNASKMVKVLNVAEKNDAAKSIADVMSRGRYQRVRTNWFVKETYSFMT